MSCKLPSIVVLFGALFVLAGCGGGADGARSGSVEGTLDLAVTDAPIDDSRRVVVEFAGVTLQPSEGDSVVFEFDEPRQIDLLALQGGGSELLLDGVAVSAGNYNWIRLAVNAGQNASDSFIELEDGSTHALFIPSGNQSGLQLVSGFVVPENATASFTIDFNLRKSVVDPASAGTPYILRPALRLVDNVEAGTIAGTVDTAIATAAACTPAVYVYEGSDIMPDDVGSAGEPISSGLVEMNDGSGEFEYVVAFLAEGDYTVALTCEAAADAPDADDDIDFVDQQNATVMAETTAIVDF